MMTWSAALGPPSGWAWWMTSKKVTGQAQDKGMLYGQ
jgi:hypothetical protein